MNAHQDSVLKDRVIFADARKDNGFYVLVLLLIIILSKKRRDIDYGTLFFPNEKIINIVKGRFSCALKYE